MAYQSLYRKYRPQRFSELVGQEHVSTALRNAVRDGRVGHAYLFSGPRGTGKTTTARLLAKALNCTNRGDDGDPCGVCESCVAIAEGSSLDVIEVDAASRSKVDEMRDLLDRVAYLSAGGAKKVYILDEVHMLSASAEAALLKTLEESPEHVVFVLATTDPLKVAPTIRSRTQHYEFMLYTIDEIAAHLADVCAKEGVAADPEALAIIARAGRGSMRDSLSLLDQAIAHGAVDLEQVSAIFGGSAFDSRIGCCARSSTRTSPARWSRSVSSSTPGTNLAVSPKTSSRRCATRSSSRPRAAACASRRRPMHSTCWALSVNSWARRTSSGCSRRWDRPSSTCAAPTLPIRDSCSRSRWCGSRDEKRGRRCRRSPSGSTDSSAASRSLPPGQVAESTAPPRAQRTVVQRAQARAGRVRATGRRRTRG